MAEGNMLFLFGTLLLDNLSAMCYSYHGEYVTENSVSY